MGAIDPKALCLSLLKADSEREVIETLERSGYWKDQKAWRFFDDNENNYSSIGNQASHSDAALVEKIVNSIDARLIDECLIRGIDPESEQAPGSIREAVAHFFEENPNTSTAGLISEWPDVKRRKVAKGTAVYSTGATPKKGDPCITVADEGEGQSPSRIPKTFMSLSRSNKLRIHFVQGKFNMGGTGVLKFCGSQNFQFVLSRRNPAFAKKGGDPDCDKWGFTIVRREDPSEGRETSLYTYLSPLGAEANPRHGEILRFASDRMPIFPETNGRPYSRDATHGSLVKLYEYSMTGFRTNIIRKDGLMSRLEVLLPTPALPVRLYECRGEYAGHEGSYDTTLTGIQIRLEDNKAESLEEGFPTSIALSVEGETAAATIFAFKKDRGATYKRSEGILFAINGQTHASLTADFFKRKSVGLSYISDSILVVVDCSRLSELAVENLFMNSRDRLRAGELKRKLEDLLEEQLKSHQLLRALQERRRRERIQDRLEDTGPMEEVLRRIMSKSPTLAKLFAEGQKLSNPLKANSIGAADAPFEGKTYPSFFKPKGKDYREVIEKECHQNMRARVFFETDAANDYFSRAIDPGAAMVFVVNEEERESILDSFTVNLQNGIATLSLTLPGTAVAGHTFSVVCRVNDVTQIQPFENRIRLCVLGDAHPGGGKGNRRKPPSNRPGSDREKEAMLSLPTIIQVFESDWDKQDPPFDQFSALSVKQAGLSETSSNGSYDFYVNMDNLFLKHEQKNVPDDAALIAARFKYGMALIGLGLIHGSLERSTKSVPGEVEEGEEESNVEKDVFETSKALGPILIPMIDSLGGISAEEVSSLDYVGESD